MKEQPSSEFGPIKLNADGRAGHCLECGRKAALASYYKFKEKRSLAQKAWNKKNKEWRKNYNREYDLKNKERLITQRLERYFAKKNTPEYIAKRRAYYKKRSSSPEYRLKNSATSRVRRLVGGKNVSLRCNRLLGCSPRQLVYSLTNGCHEIPSGMHIDHHVPVSFFNLKNDSELRVCFNWRNLRLLTAKENRKKSDTLPPDYRERLKEISEALGVTLNIYGER